MQQRLRGSRRPHGVAALGHVDGCRLVGKLGVRWNVGESRGRGRADSGGHNVDILCTVPMRVELDNNLDGWSRSSEDGKVKKRDRKDTVAVHDLMLSSEI